jgi:hypothetical protein
MNCFLQLVDGCVRSWGASFARPTPTVYPPIPNPFRSSLTNCKSDPHLRPIWRRSIWLWLSISKLRRKSETPSQVIDFSPVRTIFHLFSRFFTPFFSHKPLLFRGLCVLPIYKRRAKIFLIFDFRFAGEPCTHVEGWKLLWERTRFCRSYRFVPPGTAWYRLVPDKFFSPLDKRREKTVCPGSAKLAAKAFGVEGRDSHINLARGRGLA